VSVDVDAEVVVRLPDRQARGPPQVAVGVLAVSEGEAVDAVVLLEIVAAVVEEASDEAGLDR
jgi:hypothetical protein